MLLGRAEDKAGALNHFARKPWRQMERDADGDHLIQGVVAPLLRAQARNGATRQKCLFLQLFNGHVCLLHQMGQRIMKGAWQCIQRPRHGEQLFLIRQGAGVMSKREVMTIVFLVAVHSAEPIVCHATLLVDMKKAQAAGIHMGIGPRCQTQPLGRATDVPLIVEDDMAVRINVSPALHSFTEALVGFIDEKGTPSINNKAKISAAIPQSSRFTTCMFDFKSSQGIQCGLVVYSWGAEALCLRTCHAQTILL